jgi:integrase
MPKYERHKTKFPGVYYIVGTQVGTGKTEKIYYILWRNDEGKLIEEKAGRQFQHDMTASRAAALRAQRIQGSLPSNRERRKAVEEEKAAHEGRYTFEKLWEEYKAGKPDMERSATDQSNFTNYLLPAFGDKEPRELVPLDVDRLRLTLSKKKATATVKNVLELLRRLSNFAANKHLCDPLPFRVTMPKVNNLKTEDLNADDMARLLTILREGTVTDKDGKKTILDSAAREIMLLAIFTGMRRGEIFRLTWEDVDFRRGFITLREPKGGTDQTIPLPDEARELLEHRPRLKDCPYIFPGRGGKMKADASKHFRAIRKASGLPKDFRPMHGLRHVFASMLASSGEVDLYTLQRLLTHKSPTMTQRYAHLRDDTLKKAANVAGRIIAAAERDAKKMDRVKE